MNKIYGCIYMVTNVENGKVYIGKTKRKFQRRWKEHLQYAKSMSCLNNHFYNAILKYPISSWSIKIIENIQSSDCEKSDAKELSMAEKKWIDYYNSNNNEFGYNSTSGGDSDYIFCLESKRKMALSAGGLTESQELEVCTKYNQKINSIELANYFKVTRRTILNILDKHGICKRTSKESIGGLSDKQELEICIKYTDFKISSGLLSKEYGVTDTTILRILDRHNIVRRNAKESHNGLSHIQELEVCTKYKDLKLSSYILAKEYNVNKATILRILNKNNISVRNIKEAHNGLSKDKEIEICKEYVDGNSSCALSKKYNIAQNTILETLYSNNVFTRTLTEAWEYRKINKCQQ